MIVYNLSAPASTPEAVFASAATDIVHIKDGHNPLLILIPFSLYAQMRSPHGPDYHRLLLDIIQTAMTHEPHTLPHSRDALCQKLIASQLVLSLGWLRNIPASAFGNQTETNSTGLDQRLRMFAATLATEPAIAPPELATMTIADACASLALKPHAGRGPTTILAAGLPTCVMMTFDAFLHMPLDSPSGYPSRLWNVISDYADPFTEATGHAREHISLCLCASATLITQSHEMRRPLEAFLTLQHRMRSTANGFADYLYGHMAL